MQTRGKGAGVPGEGGGQGEEGHLEETTELSSDERLLERHIIQFKINTTIPIDDY